MILPAPKSYHRQKERGTLSTTTRTRMASLLKHMHARGRITEQALAAATQDLEQFRFAPSYLDLATLDRLAQNECAPINGTTSPDAPEKATILNP